MRIFASSLFLTALAALFCVHCSTSSTQQNFGVQFTCGTSTCDSGSQYCETTATDTHCSTLPSACGSEPTCACIGQKCCTFEPDGSLEVDDTGKSCD